MLKLRIAGEVKKIGQAGFSLVEMLIVITLIGIVGTLVTSNLMDKLNRAKVDTTKIQMRQVGLSLDDFRRVCGFYPADLESLIAPPTSGRECKSYPEEGFWKDKKKTPKDGWDNDFIYESDGNKFTLKSLGNDGKEGGTGVDKDFTNEE